MQEKFKFFPASIQSRPYQTCPSSEVTSALLIPISISDPHLAMMCVPPIFLIANNVFTSVLLFKIKTAFPPMLPLNVPLLQDCGGR